MSHNDGSWSDDTDRDVVEVGSSRPSKGWPWWPIAVAGVVALVVAATVARGHQPSAPPKSTPPAAGQASSGSSAAFPADEPTASAAASPITITQVGHRLLGVTAGWELFARGPGVLVRIQPAAGRVTRTAVPELRSTGPVSFIVGRDRAIIRPLDSVPGYVVEDGHPARGLRGALADSGPALPGPDPSRVWVQSGRGSRATVSLAGMDGSTTDVSIRIPAGAEQLAPDGNGYLLVDSTDGTYEARPDGLRRITTGTVAAAGPTHWLTVECDDRHHCANVAIDRSDGTRRVLPGPAIETSGVPDPGAISPDGSTAAVTERDARTSTLHLIDLATGADRVLDEPVRPGPVFRGTLAWSPDSRWLFLADQDEKLTVVDADTRQVQHLDVGLPPIKQLAVRSSR